MELWIRSQNKQRLSKVDDIYYVADGDFWAICTNRSALDYAGLYPTEQRCLEIIDEIQKLLMNNLDDYIVFKECEVPQETLKSFMETKKLVVTSGQNSPPASVEITPCNLRVYEMPQE